ncbi:MAG: hypothetical protein KJO98_16885 [Rhodothermia bacterium]|nr:hypothetical protein [Rhodothermia bacterium]
MHAIVGKGLVRFFRGLFLMPRYVHAWLFVLAFVNIVPALWWLEHPVAVIVIGVFVINLVLMVLLTWRFGFTRILGLGHFPWYLLNAVLLYGLTTTPPGYMQNWMLAVIAANSVSLVIDTVDVIRWLGGDREALVKGLD